MQRAKILIVVDNAENLTALLMLLKKITVEVLSVDCGNKALAEALKHDLALIILDVQMPDMDGYEVARLLHSGIKTQDIPIIFVTAAYNDESHLIEGYENGAVDYIEKPIHDIVLLSKVKVFIRLWQQQKTLEQEISLRTQENQTIEHFATHDHLTGLANRVLLTGFINKALARAKRYNFIVAVLFIDLDGFKSINDDFGHNAGDFTLQTCAVKMIKAVRRMDSIIRFGGDEFIALLTDLHNQDEALSSAQRILTTLIEPFPWNKQTIQLTASIGIACYPNHGNTEKILINNADEAMYVVKRKGKNNIAFYHKDTL